MLTEYLILTILTIFYIFFYGLLTCVETAVIVTDSVKMSIILDNKLIQGNTRRLLHKLSTTRDKCMTAMQVSTVCLSVFASSILGVLAHQSMSSLWVFVYMSSLTYGNLVFSKTLPKIIASNHYEVIMPRFAWLAWLIYLTSLPLVYLTLVWVKILGLSNVRKMHLGELKSTIDYYHQQGLLDSTEGRMLKNVTLLKKLKVGEISEVCDLPIVDAHDSIQSLKGFAENQYGKRILVKQEGAFQGVILYKDLVYRLLSGEDGIAMELCRPATRVRAGDSLIDVLVLLKRKKTSQIVIFDNYGVPIGATSAKNIYKHILTFEVKSKVG